MELLERITPLIMKGLEHLLCERGLGEVGLFSLGESHQWT